MASKKVVVGMSGGVDSSVAAYLLQQEGYDVIGVTMQIWMDENPLQVAQNGGCCGLQAVEDARKIAMQLSIPYYVMNFKKIFEQKVIDYFVKEYQEGRTPNPCIACNRFVKWEALLQRSLQIGADYIATGHYARIEQLPNGRYTLRRSVTTKKDQTYALYQLTQYQLEHTLMPVGAYTKEQIRTIADQRNWDVAKKPDSQEICFIPDQDYAAFITKYTKQEQQPGNFVDLYGNILGRHKGIIHYTVGQRRGLGICAKEPLYVLQICKENNEVILGPRSQLEKKELYANQLNFMAIEDLEHPMQVMAKIRYNHPGAQAVIEKTGEDQIHCVFEQPQRGITPGQAVVFYQDEWVIGGGTIL